MEARCDERAARVRAEEAAKSERAEERRESGRRPSFVAMQEEEKRILEDLHKETGTGIEEGGGTASGGMLGETGPSGDEEDVGLVGSSSMGEDKTCGGEGGLGGTGNTLLGKFTVGDV